MLKEKGTANLQHVSLSAIYENTLLYRVRHLTLPILKVG